MAKFTPKGIDPAYPQKNFVKASFENAGDAEGWYAYMYGHPMEQQGPFGQGTLRKKSSGFGHSIGQRAGKLRYSGTKGAHRIGKR